MLSRCAELRECPLSESHEEQHQIFFRELFLNRATVVVNNKDRAVRSLISRLHLKKPNRKEFSCYSHDVTDL